MIVTLQHPRLVKRRGAFTLVEVVVSVVIVSMLLVASLQAVSIANLGQYRIAERTRGNELARSLMTEIVQLAYADPGAAPVFGPESGQTRATWDDVDDYNGFTESPPTYKDGTAQSVPSASTWRRSVAVAYVNPQTLASSASDAGAKQITVSVYHNSKLVASVVAIRTSAP